MEQTTIFDAIEAAAARDRGIEQAGDNRSWLLQYARSVAVEVGQRKRRVTADDVIRELIEKHGWQEGRLGNAAGGLFRGKSWRDTGETLRSERVSAHRRKMTVWEYVGK
jgi:hypothetical protein